MDDRRDRVVVGLWTVYGGLLALTVVTYFRLGPGETYHFADSGVSGAVSRSVTYLNYPVALAAIAMLWSVRRGAWAVLATVLCGFAAVPGVVSEAHLTARWVNVPAVLGVLLALVLTLTASDDPTRRPLGGGRWWLFVLVTLVAVPHLVAAAGFYADHLPLVGDLFRGSQPTPGQPSLPSVHRGLHEGLFGALLLVTAIALSARRVPRPLGLYLSLMLTYGAWVFVGDVWHEQVVKRGWTGTKVPDVLTPGLTVAWGVLLLVALLVYVVALREPNRHVDLEVTP